MSNAVASRQPNDRGIAPPGPRPVYQSYRSPYGPKYAIARNAFGVDLKMLGRFGLTAGLFGAAGGVALLFFASDVPRVRIDIMQKFPVIGEHYYRETPPEDDPF